VRSTLALQHRVEVDLAVLHDHVDDPAVQVHLGVHQRDDVAVSSQALHERDLVAEVGDGALFGALQLDALERVGLRLGLPPSLASLLLLLFVQ